MLRLLRKAGALCVCELLILSSLTGCAARKAAVPSSPREALLKAQLQKSYLELFQIAATLNVSASDIESQREAFKAGEKSCLGQFKDHAKQYEKQLKSAQKTLKETTSKLTEPERKQLHCRIQNLDQLQREAGLLYQHGIPTAYDNLNAKLDLLEKWPALFQQAREEIASESYMKRRWSNVNDIGFREIASGQEDDIKRGQEAIEELKRNGLLPATLDNAKIAAYV